MIQGGALNYCLQILTKLLDYWKTIPMKEVSVLVFLFLFGPAFVRDTYIGILLPCCALMSGRGILDNFSVVETFKKFMYANCDVNAG